MAIFRSPPPFSIHLAPKRGKKRKSGGSFRWFRPKLKIMSTSDFGLILGELDFGGAWLDRPRPYVATCTILYAVLYPQRSSDGWIAWQFVLLG